MAEIDNSNDNLGYKRIIFLCVYTLIGPVMILTAYFTCSVKFAENCSEITDSSYHRRHSNSSAASSSRENVSRFNPTDIMQNAGTSTNSTDLDNSTIANTHELSCDVGKQNGHLFCTFYSSRDFALLTLKALSLFAHVASNVTHPVA